MPGIWGLNGNNVVSNRKISSKITFKEGERFTGKIIKKDGEKNVVIKLADGWKFEAEIEGDVNLEENSVLKFKVKDTVDGKLKLEIVKEEVDGFKKLNKDQLILKFMREKGVSKEEAMLMKEMIQREIPLTKENINKFKEVLSFLENIKNNSEEEESFINKFIDSKVVDTESKNIEQTLKSFFQVFKKMSKEEVMVFLENNVELTKENVEGYNKLFKEDKLNGFIKEIKTLIKEKNDIEREVEKSDVPKEKIEIDKKDLENKEAIKGNNRFGYVKPEEKGSVVGLIKSIVGENNKEVKDIFKEIILHKKSIEVLDLNTIDEKFKGITEGKFIRALQENINLKSDGKPNNVSVEDFLKLLENINTEDDVVENTQVIGEKVKGKENVEEVLTKILGKEIKLNKEEYKKILQVIEGFEKEKLTEEVKEKIINKPQILDANNMKKDEIIKELKEKIINTREIAGKLEENFLGKGSEKILAFVKNNIGEFKIFNAISNEYYYLDIPIKLQKEEYPCKLIIKDNRKDNKSIDKNNVKVIVSIKTINLGLIDSYIHLSNNNMEVKLKCKRENIGIIKEKIDNLKKALETMNLNIKISVEEKIDEVTLANCREFFKKKENRILDTIV
ncbi:MAG: hypothetical protein ACRC28_16070 [Clostridium sp.]|uniref:hypothetical protein n=1 Tax=Clostridium sp. TaxID=1506 RepID=UPI003F3041F8